MVIYLILGMLMDTLPVIILTAPIFVPIAVMLGIDKVYMGVVTVVIMAYGMLTPPFGANIFISSGFTGQPVASILKYSRFLYVFGLIAIFLIVYIPYLLFYR